MDALEALQQRVSVPRLGGEIPAGKVLENLFQAALRAPDHAQLKPWRFLLISGESREALGDLFVKAQLEDDPTLNDIKQQKARGKPLRAPLIVVVIAVLKDRSKVPEIEQILSAGAAAQNMLVAAHAQGLGAMWRTGSMAYHATVLAGLGLSSHEKLLGYLYLGDIEGRTRAAPELNSKDYFKTWPALDLMDRDLMDRD